MKRTMILMVILFCLFAVAGCGKNTNTAAASEGSTAVPAASAPGAAGTAAPAAAAQSGGKETAKANNAKVYYSGKMS